MDIDFSSMNPYQSLEVVIAESPQELVLELKKIRTPIKIMGFTTYGTRQACYVVGDIRPKQNLKAAKGTK